MISQIHNRTVKIKKVLSQSNVIIIPYLHQYGTIVGKKKLINRKYTNVLIIEFINKTRIWMLPQEVELISSIKDKKFIDNVNK